MKVRKRLKQRYRQLKLHPVTKGKEFFGLLNYILFHIKNSIIKEQVYNWIEGLKFYARKGDAGIVGNIYFGLFEFEESIFLLHFLNKEDVFLDIGANVGHYSLLMSGVKKIKSIAIEPVPKTYSQLLKNIKLNNLEQNITAINMGVSNNKGNLFFSTDKGTMDRIVTEKYPNSVKVNVDTIDSFIGDTMPIAAKIDVEGYEKFVLEGASTFFKKEEVKVLILELNNSGKAFGISDIDIYNLVLSFGYKPYKYDPKKRMIYELKAYNKHKFNTLFIKDYDFIIKRVKESRKIKIKGIEF